MYKYFFLINCLTFLLMGLSQLYQYDPLSPKTLIRFQVRDHSETTVNVSKTKKNAINKQ